MFQVFILVCAIGVPPADCQTNSAIQTIRGPEAPNEVACGLFGQAFFAQVSQQKLREGEYLKITCTRTSIGKTVG
jgi:hypothetical protein